MRYLIIPDVHEQCEKFLHIFSKKKALRCQKVVQLGDWFDSHGSTPTNVDRTIQILKNFLSDPDNISIIGNHDYQYFSPFGSSDYCSGFSLETKRKIRENISTEEMRKFVISYKVDNVIFSHAGIDEYVFPYDNDYEKHKEREAAAIDELLCGGRHSLFAAGFDVGGNAAIGGPCWIRFHNLNSPKEYYQIVGHTYSEIVRFKENACCLDTGLEYFGVLDSDQKKLEIYSTKGSKLIGECYVI